MKIKILSRIHASILFECDADSMKLAVELAVTKKINLRSADLSYADLSDANLRDANLRSADLSYADLSDANLRDANLSYADLSDANLRSADLSYADLSDANLRDANLRDANLSYADLSDAKNMRLPTGETMEEYLTQTVPALLTAGGKKLEEIATVENWSCHSWDNCPMAKAFDVHKIDDVPILYRPRAEQFVALFDGKHIPLEKVNPNAVKA